METHKTMKLYILCVAVFAVALAAPAPEEHADILKLESDVGPEGYNFA